MRPMAQEQAQAPICPRSGATIFSVQSTAQQAHSDATEHGAPRHGNDEHRTPAMASTFESRGTNAVSSKDGKTPFEARVSLGRHGTTTKIFPGSVRFRPAKRVVEWQRGQPSSLVWQITGTNRDTISTCLGNVVERQADNFSGIFITLLHLPTKSRCSISISIDPPPLCAFRPYTFIPDFCMPHLCRSDWCVC